MSITSAGVVRRALTFLLCAPLASIGLATAQATPSQALTFTPCTSGAGFTCATLSVPLDRDGQVAGMTALKIERLQAGASPSRSAVVALAGGPGQAAIPLAQATARVIGVALGTRDLLVFDQRGTGASGALACPTLEAEALGVIGQAFELCAKQIGTKRGAYTTQESVADLETIREAAGYEKLVLFGVSYGTKVALEYAESHPANVEAMVLDSVVPPERADPFSMGMFQAMKPVLEELCSGSACAGITSNPLGDMATLTARLHRHALSGYVYDGSGRRHHTTLSNVDLLNLIGAGDLNPALRGLLPAAVQSALHGDPSPLLRLNLLSEGLVPNLPGTPLGGSRANGAAPADRRPAASSDGVDEALFVDTTCEEASFPWQRSAAPQTRLEEGLAALRATPAQAFYPFDASTAWADSLLEGCATWPNVAPPPPPIGALPSAPTLILSGAQDLRTPTSGAEAVAARIPGAQVIVVPYTGHSVLGTDFSGCAKAAVKAFFSSETASPCQAAHNPFGPTPVTPRKLTFVKAVGGLSGRAGSTLAAVLDTILDLERQVIGATLQSQQELPNGSSFGGLRGGFARFTATALRLHRLSFVDGVQLSGSFPVRHGHLSAADLRVEGSQAAQGTIHVGASARVSGTLGGRHFNVNLAKVKLARAEANAPTPTSRLWPAPAFPAPALARVR
ncbi:MAG TPA: alpha/beta fold hydrolase [Solirubrobacteraceae bacterium]|nr:alpha/beta fold hydrolase [Solirubrobacteraceae bacterium]